MELFFEIHHDLPREAPGSDAATARALAMVPPLPAQPHLLDLGCGPGAQTLVLAKETGGQVVAVDTHQPFLDDLTRRAVQAGLAHQITPLNASMFALEVEEAHFDLIWAEGAIYIMGFEDGLTAWRRLLKPGGAVAVTELTWLADDPPDEVRRFWMSAYPAMQRIDDNIALLQAAGYRSVGHFVLPESAWWDAYYTPLEHRIATLCHTYRDDADALAALAAEQKEIDLYHAYASWYGYVFYVMVRNDA